MALHFNTYVIFHFYIYLAPFLKNHNFHLTPTELHLETKILKHTQKNEAG